MLLTQFQYRLQSFNTSHVLIKLRFQGTRETPELCFNTSHVLIKLSNEFFNYQRRRFNTSHVLIKLRRLTATRKLKGCFNTSHVLIKPSNDRFHWTGNYVSIHLMFLLNEALIPFVELAIEFQYISCSY